ASNIDLERIERIAAREATPLTRESASEWSPRQAMTELGGPIVVSPEDGAADENVDRHKAGGSAAPRRKAGPPVGAGAGGAAFAFSYAEHAELLAAAGAEVVTFDPLHDEKLPSGTAALVIGGGFPEVYAAKLAENTGLIGRVRDFASAGGVIAAEC